MTTFGLTIFIFLELIMYLIFFDIILSWLSLFGINFRPRILNEVVDPIYKKINDIIPTTLGPIRFDAFIAILIIYGLEYLVILFFPGVYAELNRLTSFVG